MRLWSGDAAPFEGCWWKWNDSVNGLRGTETATQGTLSSVACVRVNLFHTEEHPLFFHFFGILFYPLTLYKAQGLRFSNPIGLVLLGLRFNYSYLISRGALLRV